MRGGKIIFYIGLKGYLQEENYVIFILGKGYIHWEENDVLFGFLQANAPSELLRYRQMNSLLKKQLIKQNKKYFPENLKILDEGTDANLGIFLGVIGPYVEQIEVQGFW
jgi:hypothetical protein